jgi:hypothetical protein
MHTIRHIGKRDALITFPDLTLMGVIEKPEQARPSKSDRAPEQPLRRNKALSTTRLVVLLVD